MKFLTTTLFLILTYTAYGQFCANCIYDIEDKPTLYEVKTGKFKEGQKDKKVLFIFKDKQTAQEVTGVLGYVLIAVGAGFDGYSEYLLQYGKSGKDGNFDKYHITRDIGHLTTGLGTVSLGCNITLDEKNNFLKTGVKLLWGAVLYRIVAESVYKVHAQN